MKRMIAIFFGAITLMSLTGCNTENYNNSKSSVSQTESNKDNSKSEINSESGKEESKTEIKSESKSNVNQINNKTEIPETEIVFDKNYAFLGNSIVGDLESYDVVDNADVYSYIGLNVATVFDQKLDNHKKPLLEEMLSNNYKTIFIMFGMNEVGWSYSDIFVDNYCELIDEIRTKLPDTEIYLLSITPITETLETDKESDLTTDKIAEYNKLIEQIAKDKNIDYLDVNSYLRDENGFIADDDSPDGYHLQPNCSLRMVNAIKYLIDQ